MHRWLCTGFLNDTRDRIECTINEKPLSLFFLQVWSKFLWVSLSIFQVLLKLQFLKFYLVCLLSLQIIIPTSDYCMALILPMPKGSIRYHTNFRLLQGTTILPMPRRSIWHWSVLYTLDLQWLKRWKTDIHFISICSSYCNRSTSPLPWLLR